MLMRICVLLIISFVFMPLQAFAKQNNDSGELHWLRQLEGVSGFSLLLQHRASAGFIKADGATGRNRNKLSDVAAQRDALWVLRRAIIEQDAKKVEAAVKAMEFAFRYQNKDGSFKNGRGASKKKAVTADAFFLQAFGNVYLLIEESSFKERFIKRLDRLKPQLEQSMRWLYANEHNLLRMDHKAPNRLLFDGIAFLFNGYILKNEEYIKVGEKFVDAALALKDDQGFLKEHGGYDSSYQAVCNYNLLRISSYAQSPDLIKKVRDAAIEGTHWQLTRIEKSGRVKVAGNARTGLGQEKLLGKIKDVNYSEVALSLYYFSMATGSQEAVSIANKVVEYALHNYARK